MHGIAGHGQNTSLPSGTSGRMVLGLCCSLDTDTVFYSVFKVEHLDTFVWSGEDQALLRCLEGRARHPMHAVGVLAAALLLVGAHAGPDWTPSTFPNPKQNITLCGRGVPSNICDPDGVVTREEADRIEGVIKDIHAGADPYVRKKCGDNLEGFMVRGWGLWQGACQRARVC